MDPNEFPTKGNLILAKNTLRLSKQGYDLLDKKRNVLIKEIMALDEKAKAMQSDIDKVFADAYKSLQSANIDNGITNVERFSYGIAQENSIGIRTKSIMGVEIPTVSFNNTIKDTPNFAFGNTSSSLDDAFVKFNKAKDWMIELAMIENAAYRLAVSIRKTQKRANALKNVTIPRYEELVKNIQDTLEERERDEFTRLKVVKRSKLKRQNH